MRSDIETVGKLRLLEEIRSFEGTDPIALWKDAQFDLSHVNDFTHVAVVAEAQWVRTIATAADNFLAAVVKAFELTQLEAARTWLLSAPDHVQPLGMAYQNHADSNVVEITVEGKITAADIGT
ncbi:STAS/SEC14 domain-containing protein [Lyngbya confervoides BDU141951]|uniref:STAS/SEC14 domain-containing protein n=1 Tax=Lyngbya confervoides BDU141951 TaxID=1574623 RepID=A0ABD4T7D7_9CYAN|nr:STAS/SEC14 domain-containing protein [Lyngbya confervoides BDU141951]